MIVAEARRRAEQVAARSEQPVVRERAQAVLAALDGMRLDNYAGEARQGEFGSNGLAIYFPATGTDFRTDDGRVDRNDAPRRTACGFHPPRNGLRCEGAPAHHGG